LTIGAAIEKLLDKIDHALDNWREARKKLDEMGKKLDESP